MSLCSYHKLVMAPCCRLLITPSFTPGVRFSETKTTTNSHLSPHFISQNKNEHSGSNFSVSVSTIYHHHHKLKAELALLVQFGCLAGSNTSYFNCSHLQRLSLQTPAALQNCDFNQYVAMILETSLFTRIL